MRQHFKLAMDDDDDNEVSISTTIVLNPGPKTRRDEYLRKVGKALSRHLWYHGLVWRFHKIG